MEDKRNRVRKKVAMAIISYIVNVHGIVFVKMYLGRSLKPLKYCRVAAQSPLDQSKMPWETARLPLDRPNTIAAI